ncbi:MAG: MtnX-like HAD-IB family phosphatase [Candidatus Omnitrophica bacterium]|nr:MtnX-like HAD-IB family phosphatase [Candidatus Omnitrophota bacterium]
MKRIDGKKAAVFFDFDNTITTNDTIDGILIDHSENEKWIDLEKKWKNKKIGSYKCLKGQMQGVRITKKELDKYLLAIKLDPYFKKLVLFLESKKITPMILSDNFDSFIRYVLKKNGIKGVRIFANRIKLSGGRFITAFPFRNKKCSKCAHCKKDNMIRNTPAGTASIYVGDGLSDVCPANHADIVFAKDYLSKVLKPKIPHIKFNSLKNVYNHLRKGLL